MRDLEIRGAGNLLGGEQSGHVAAVGFEMYCDLVRRAVAELKQQPVEEPRTARLDADIDAYIPAAYVPLETARLDIHHRIAAARDEQALAGLEEELNDRFGPLPGVVRNLLDMQVCRLRAGVLGAATVSYRQGRLKLSDLRLDGDQRDALEAAGLEFAYHPSGRILVVRPAAGDGLSVVKETMDVIIDSLLSSAGKL